jgi:hypothetical protein
MRGRSPAFPKELDGQLDEPNAVPWLPDGDDGTSQYIPVPDDVNPDLQQ